MPETLEQKLAREYSQAYSGPKPDDSIIRGLKTWIPDIPGFAGDILDAGNYLLQRAKGVRHPPVQGKGEEYRRKVQERLYGQQPRTQPELSEPHESSGAEETVRMLNPAFFMSPAKLAQSPVAIGGLAAAFGVPMEGFGGLGIIKKGGGNWVNGSVEDALKPLRIDTPFSEADYAKMLGDLGLTYEQFSKMPQRKSAELARNWAESNLTNPVNTWIDKQLTRYIRNDMGTMEDPIRDLAEQGIIHVDSPQELMSQASPSVRRRRSAGGFPTQEVGSSQTARRWERDSDLAIDPTTYDEANPWLDRTLPSYKEMLGRMGGDFAVNNPNALVHQINPTSGGIRDLGFDHLIDELSNAINPESGLPRHLQFPADRLNKVSVPQAVQRVHDINNWRAEQQLLADQLRANNLAVQTYKEYPDKGMKWVELGLPEELQRDRFEKVGSYREALKDALGYEGDAMGHCVGGYCDDVLSGRSSIFSLRDAKGEPHVTVEVKPNIDKPGFTDVEEMFVDDMGRPPRSPMELDDWAFNQGIEMNDAMETAAGGGFKIHQIKGKQNRAPSEEYLPFVQDFVRSRKWNSLGDDYENIGTNFERYPDGTWGPAEENPKYYLGQPDGAYVPFTRMNPQVAQSAGLQPGNYTAKQIKEWFDNPENLARYMEEENLLFSPELKPGDIPEDTMAQLRKHFKDYLDNAYGELLQPYRRYQFAEGGKVEWPFTTHLSTA